MTRAVRIISRSDERYDMCIVDYYLQQQSCDVEKEKLLEAKRAERLKKRGESNEIAAGSSTPVPPKATPTRRTKRDAMVHIMHVLGDDNVGCRNGPS